MDDFADTPSPSYARPILYGAGIGAAGMAIFFTAYVIAPNIGLAGTFLIAAAITAGVLMALNFAPTRASERASEDVAALVRGEDPEPAAPARRLEPVGRDAVSPEARVEALWARVTELRTEADKIDRAASPSEWVEKVGILSDELIELARLEVSFANPKRRRSGLGHYRQAAKLLFRITKARGHNKSNRAWAAAQFALGESLLMLGEAEGARDEVMAAVNAFSAGLEVGEISAEERQQGENGLARAEGVLAGMADEQNPMSDADFL